VPAVAVVAGRRRPCSRWRIRPLDRRRAATPADRFFDGAGRATLGLAARGRRTSRSLTGGRETLTADRGRHAAAGIRAARRSRQYNLHESRLASRAFPLSAAQARRRRAPRRGWWGPLTPLASPDSPSVRERRGAARQVLSEPGPPRPPPAAPLRPCQAAPHAVSLAPAPPPALLVSPTGGRAALAVTVWEGGSCWTLADAEDVFGRWRAHPALGI